MKSVNCFDTPSLFSGVAKIFDIGATYDDYSKHISPDHADYDALAQDWQAVGNDLTISN